MKTRTRDSRIPLPTLALLGILVQPLAATSYFWDGIDGTADADGGDGNWEASTTNWDDAATAGNPVAWPALSTGADDAVFGGAAGAVAIDAGGITAHNIDFTTTGYALSGGTLTLDGTTPLITAASGISATISSAISGTVTKRGDGTLVLSGNSTANLGDQHQGTLEVQAGTWSVGTGFRLTQQANGTLTLKNSTNLETTGNLILTSVTATRTGTLNVQDNATMKVNGNLQTNRGASTEIGQMSVLNFGKLTVTGGLDVGKNLGGTNERTRGAFTSNGNAEVSIAGTTRLSNSGDNFHGTATLSVLGNSKFTTDALQLRPRREKNAPVLAVVNNTATLTATNGVILTTADRIASNTATTTTLRVAGSGTLETPGITSDASVGNTTLQMQLQGGTIKALGSNATFITGFSAAPVINASGITFNSNGFDIGIDVGLSGTTGFVRKTGAGTLTYLAGTTYGGSTTVSEGTLALGASGTIAGSSIDIASGATLDVSLVGGWTLGASQTLTGTGTLAGNTTVNGAVSPGSPSGTLAASNDVTFATGSSLNIDLNISGTLQVESTTAVGTVAADGNVDVTVTGAGITGSPITLNVAVLTSDTPETWAGKVRDALNANAAITALYTVGGTDASISLTRITPAANDTTLNVALANGTGNPGITADATSDNTTAGAAPGTDQFAVSGALDITNATLNLNITGTLTAPAYVIATYGSLTPAAGPFGTINGTIPPGYAIDYAYSGNQIAIKSTGGDIFPPSWTATWPKVDTATSGGLTVRAKTDETGSAYYVVLADGASAPSAAQVKAGNDAADAPALKSGTIALTANTENTAAVTGLATGTAYDVYLVAEDAVPNLQSSPAKVDASTLTTFAEWIGGFSVGGLTGQGDDPDKDGKSNVVEFALNSSPANGSTRGKVFVKLATVGGTPNVLTLTAAVRSGATFAADANNQKAVVSGDALTYVIEAANTLADWGTPVVTEVTDPGDLTAIQAGLPAPDSGWVYKTFRSDGSAPSDTSDYIRVKITSP